MFRSVITTAEIEDRFSRSRRAGAHAKAGRLADWLETLLHLHTDRVLPIDLPIARRIGALTALSRRQGRDPGLADVAIVATAIARGCTLLTRNLPIRTTGCHSLMPASRLVSGLAARPSTVR